MADFCWCPYQNLGQLFLGGSFSALTGTESPIFLRYLDDVGFAWAAKGLSPLTFRLLQRLPIKSLNGFLASASGVYDVCSFYVSSSPMSE
jgi:hypothetical protein